MGVIKTIKKYRSQIGAGVAGLAVGAGAGYLAGKLRRRGRRKTNLLARVRKLALRVKESQLKRRLFKEQTKVI